MMEPALTLYPPPPTSSFSIIAVKDIPDVLDMLIYFEFGTSSIASQAALFWPILALLLKAHEFYLVF